MWKPWAEVEKLCKAGWRWVWEVLGEMAEARVGPHKIDISEVYAVEVWINHSARPVEQFWIHQARFQEKMGKMLLANPSITRIHYATLSFSAEDGRIAPGSWVLAYRVSENR